jgi:hypothetical protein
VTEKAISRAVGEELRRAREARGWCRVRCNGHVSIWRTCPHAYHLGTSSGNKMMAYLERDWQRLSHSRHRHGTR